MTGLIRGAALPMGFNRQPHYRDGLLLVGDAGGMVNPFNGEGIAYAMESGRLAAEVIAQAFARGDDAGRERVLATYPQIMKDDLGGYFTLGRWFAAAIGHPEVMRLATKYGLPHHDDEVPPQDHGESRRTARRRRVRSAHRRPLKDGAGRVMSDVRLRGANAPLGWTGMTASDLHHAVEREVGRP